MPIHGYPGNVITANPVAPTSTVATGVWTTEQQLIAKAAGNWPLYVPPYQISRSLRFNSADSAYLNRTFGTPTDNKKWTFSCWIKRSKLSSAATTAGSLQFLCTLGSGAQTFFGYGWTDDNDLVFGYGGFARIRTNAVFRDLSAWYHVMLVFDSANATAANRALIYINGVAASLVTINAVGLNDTTLLNSAVNTGIGEQTGQPWVSMDMYLAETYFIDGQALTPSSFGRNNVETGVWEPLAYTGTYGTNGFYLPFSDNSTLVDVASDSAAGSFSKRLTSGTNIGGMTSNGGLAAAFNGAFNNEASSAVSSTPTSGYVTTNSVGKDWGSGVTKTITAFQINSPTNDGFIGSQLAVGFKLQGSTDNFSSSVVDLYSGTTPAGFNQSVLVTSGITTSTAYRYHRIVINGNGTNNTRFGQVMLYETGSFGVNQWQTNNFSVTAGAGNDSLVDTPTSYGTDTGVGGTVRGNYSTLNPLFVNNTYPITYSNGNLDATRAGGGQGGITNTLGMSSGKWYWEVVFTTYTYNIGITTNPAGSLIGAEGAAGYNGGGGTSIAIQNNGVMRTNGTTGSTYTSWTTGDIMGIALDMDGGNLYFSKNGTVMNSGSPVATSLTGSTWFFITSLESGASLVANFGQRAFAYTAPSGFKALCTQNLPTPTIGATSTTQANKYMDVTLYTGNGAVRSITNSGSMQPDFVWDKLISGANSHRLFDSLRGVEKALYSNLSNAEATETGTLTSFNSNGFSLGTNTETNTNGSTYVAWQWNAGGSTVTNTSGTISAQVRANTTSGFSIISYTGNKTSGATIGHGLGVAPAMVIIKERANASEWIIYHQSLGATQAIYFTTAAANTNSIWFNNTAPSSTVITLGNSDGTNRANTMIAYAFAPVAGYSAFGSFTGNGADDGVFVYTGFRPEWVMLKSATQAYRWYMLDAARNTYNVMNGRLFANNSNAEATNSNVLDFTSNGFKIRTSDLEVNGSGQTIIYACFAEFPFKYALAR